MPRTARETNSCRKRRGEVGEVDAGTCKEIDETINSICIWIRWAIDTDEVFKGKNRKEVIEMTNAMANLVSARADVV